MGLRFRLALAYSVVLLAMMLIAALLYVRGAREDVSAELASTRLVAEHFSIVSPGVEPAGAMRLDLSPLRATRHLRVDYLDTDGRLVESSRTGTNGHRTAAPAWFATLVSPHAAFESIRRPIATEGHHRGTLVLTPDPANEIDEKWQDAKELAAISVVLFVAVNAVLYVVLARALRPIERLIAVLDQVKAGNLHVRLPAFSLPEFQRIGQRFNRMADALEHGAQQNQQLTLKLMQAREEEQKRLARELHDELGQSLTAIQADAAAILRNGRDNPSVRESADAIVDVTQQMLSSIRGMLCRLRPEALDEFGLAFALQELIEGWRRRHPDIACIFRIEGDLRESRDETAATLYRSVQEALTNVARHSGATRVDIDLKRIAGPTDGRLVLSVRDNGRGAPPDRAHQGFGLLGLRERAAALGGSLAIPTEPRAGFHIELELPLGKATA